MQERQEYMDEPPGRRVKSDEDAWHLMSPEAGISLIYFPFLANEKVPGVDPMKADFMSTWNFICLLFFLTTLKEKQYQRRLNELSFFICSTCGDPRP